MKVDVRDPSCTLIAMVPTLHRLKIAQSGRFNESALRNAYPFRKPEGWLKPRRLVKAKMPTVVSGGKSYAAVASTRRESKSVEYQTSLTFFFLFSERPLRTTESNVRSSGGPGSVSTGTQASSVMSRTVSADARVPCECAKCSSERDRCSADPPKTASRGSASPHKMASKGSATPSKTAPKGSARPLKTAPSNDDSLSSRCSPTKVRVEGVLVDVEEFSHPRRSAPSSRPQVPPKPVASDRLKKAEQNLVLSNQFSALSDDEMGSSSISPD